MESRILYFKTCSKCKQVALTDQPHYVHLCEANRRPVLQMEMNAVGSLQSNTRPFDHSLRLRINGEKETVELICETCYTITDPISFKVAQELHGAIVCTECGQDCHVSLATILQWANEGLHAILANTGNPFDYDKRRRSHV